MRMEPTASFTRSRNDDLVQVHIRYCDRPSEYVVCVPANYTVKQLRQMVMVHYSAGGDAQIFGSQDAQFLLLHSDEHRRLADDSTLAQENVKSGANLLLLEKNARISPSARVLLEQDRTLAQLRMGARAQGLLTIHATGAPSCEQEIRHITAQLPAQPRVPAPSRCGCSTMEVHGNLLLLRRILMGVAHSSLRLLGDARLTQEAFIAILDKLERRHRSSMKPTSIKKLKDMGFSEPKAVIALKCKSSVEAAAEWLTQNDPHEHLPPAPPFADLTEEEDPVEVLMPRFWHFRRFYFVPQPSAYRRLVTRGFEPIRAYDALMMAENEENLAKQVLDTERKYNCDLLYTAPPPHHPIMTSIFGSSIVQVSLHKPKVLYALLALCANPNNANLWLSDPDTSGVVNLVLKLYHEERFNVDCCCSETSTKMARVALAEEETDASY